MRQYGLIGEKLGHSFSPMIHEKLADYSYQLFELAPDQLGQFLEEGDFAGLNVTIPYKMAVMPYCKVLTDQAKRIGSVNTIVRQPDGSLLGHNTDYDGFCYLLRSAGAEVAGKKALVLGTGGASLTVHTVLKDLGARETVSISRSGPNNYNNLELHSDAELIVNATPVGMYPNNGVSPIDISLFPRLEGVFDLIYNPAKTRLLLDAEERGLRWANGLGMLVAQAKASSERFIGAPIPDSRVDEIAREMERSTRNILLVGMPGCGKTTVGQMLSQKLGRPFVDTDPMVEEMAGCTIPEIFATRGEEAFRRLEHQVLCQVSRQSGTIIATGGGIVTRPENLAPMRQNSTVVFLRRPVDQLPTAGRPISQSHDLNELYRQRLPLYQRAADWTVDNIILDDTVKEIMRRLSK